jgi:hypothetical protein
MVILLLCEETFGLRDLAAQEDFWLACVFPIFQLLYTVYVYSKVADVSRRDGEFYLG